MGRRQKTQASGLRALFRNIYAHGSSVLHYKVLSF